MRVNRLATAQDRGYPGGGGAPDGERCRAERLHDLRGAGDDGFGYRRRVLHEARRLLAPGAAVFLSISLQYGRARIAGLAQEAPGFAYGGVLASTEWTPFDLGRADLLECLELYAAEEARGGAPYEFCAARALDGGPMSAREALARYRDTGESPSSKSQTHLFRFG